MIKQVFYCFTAYDNVQKKKVKFNCNARYGAIRHRNEALQDKRYSHVSDIFTDSLDLESAKIENEHALYW